MGRHVAEERALNAGWSTKLHDNDLVIIGPAWDRAVDGQEIVGSCRTLDQAVRPCTGYLRAIDKVQIGAIWWYEAECMRCGAVSASPNGKVLRRSSRREEMPEGAWTQRMKAIEKIFGKEPANT